jgi:thiol-disulfide isomerase/thioredoxin
VHSSGTCIGDGSQCSGCANDADCATGGLCLQYSSTKERFCAESCATGGCPSGYDCVTLGNGAKQCVHPQQQAPTCTPKLQEMMAVGATMDDYAMIGVTDDNGNGDMLDEPLKIVRLSDFAETHKLILFNVSAVWCGACQQETLEFAAFEQSHPEVAIFQTLFDGQQPGSDITQNLLAAWVSQLNAKGAVGMDPAKMVLQYNAAGSTPLNMVIDAKTRKILHKWNGYAPNSLEGIADYYLEQLD